MSIVKQEILYIIDFLVEYNNQFDKFEIFNDVFLFIKNLDYVHILFARDFVPFLYDYYKLQSVSIMYTRLIELLNMLQIDDENSDFAKLIILNRFLSEILTKYKYEIKNVNGTKIIEYTLSYTFLYEKIQLTSENNKLVYALFTYPMEFIQSDLFDDGFKKRCVQDLFLFIKKVNKLNNL